MIDIVTKLTGKIWGTEAQRILWGAQKAATRELVDTGESDVERELYPGHGVLSGEYKRNIHGQVYSSRFGKVSDSGVVYGPWLEGVGGRNFHTRFKGYAAFRNARQHLAQISVGVRLKYLRSAITRMR